MPRCQACAAELPDGVVSCWYCKAPVSTEGPADVQAHVAFALSALQEWARRGWIDARGAAEIERDLRSRLAAGPTRPPLGTESLPLAAPPATAPASQSEGERPGLPPPPPAPPVGATVAGARAEGTRPPEPKREPWLAEFLATHWQRLLAVMAVAFIVVGMRQLLGWQWVSELGRRATPLAPALLSAALLRTGLRARERAPIGAFAALSAGVVLSAFTCFSANKHWLGGAVPGPWAESAGIALATALAETLRRRLRDERFSHLVAAGLVAGLLNGVRAATGLPLLDESAAPAQAGALLALAGVALLDARRLGPPIAAQRLVWAHGLCALAAFRVAPLVLPGDGMSAAQAAVFVLAAAGYSVGCRWFGGGVAPTAASVYAGAAVYAIAARTGSGGWDTVSCACSLAGLHALALARWPAGPGVDEAAASRARAAFHEMAQFSAALGGVALVGGWTMAPEHWPTPVVSAMLCALLLAACAAALDRPMLLIGAAAAAQVGGAQAMRHALPDATPTWGVWLTPGAVAVALSGIAVRRMAMPECAARWSRPVLLAGGAGAGLALAALWASAVFGQATSAFWWSAGGQATVSALAAALLFGDDDLPLTRLWVALACAGATLHAFAAGALWLEPIWWAACLLPACVAIWGASATLPERLREPVGLPLERTASTIAGFAGLHLLPVFAQRPEAAPGATVATLAAYGAGHAVLLRVRRAPEHTALASLWLSAAAGVGFTALGVRLAGWGAAIAGVAAVWVALAGWIARSRAALWEDALHALALHAVASGLAVLGAGVALACVMVPGQGHLAIVALLLAGAVGFGQWLLGMGALRAHAGAASCFAAWCLVTYDAFGAGAGVLDFYLAPVGLYLLVLGHLAGERRGSRRAAAFWWLGLLTTMTPTFAAFLANHVSGGSPLHALLLAVECIAAVLWGIRERIRAFVACGVLFATGFVAVLGAGPVVQTWSGVFALALGVALLAFVLVAGYRRAEIAEGMQRLGAELKTWR